MTYRRTLLLILITSVIISLSYILSGSRASEAAPPVDSSLPLEDSRPAYGLKTTTELIQFWGDRVERTPHDFISLTYLGQSFISRGRETGDAGAYAKAEAALRQALALNDNYETALAYLATVHFVQHAFPAALELAQRVYKADPSASQALATIGDAWLELGNYAEAETAYQKLAETESGPPIDSRLARLAWLQGRPDAALAHLQRAVAEAASLGLSGERLAWYHCQLGELYFNTGQLEAAGQQYAAALEQAPRYYLGLAGLGKVQAAQGNDQAAIEHYEQAAAAVPQPDFLAALGDLYLLAGQPDQARLQYETVEYTGRLAEANRQLYNRQLANFYADHDLHLPEALQLAAAELETRQDIYGYDTAAWAYYKNGRLAEAQAAMAQALRLGTRDARLYYHAGMIAQASGRLAEAEQWLAEALAINPHFDLRQARLARATLDRIQATR